MNELLPPDALKTEGDALKVKPRHYELALAEQAMRRANGSP